MKISVSFINSIFNERETVKKITKTDADYIHLDIMDGKFVKAKNYSFREIVKIIGDSNKKLDVHLMVNNPEKYLDDYASLNVDYFTFHCEITKNIADLIAKIKSYGLKVGISIKPNTDLDILVSYLNEIDQVLVMSVEPGLGGQEFLSETINKIETLNNYRQQKNYNYIISVDGGINDTNIDMLKQLNVDMVVSGSFICLNENFQTQIDKLR